jgi:murein L,D-transpeptidase YafK
MLNRYSLPGFANLTHVRQEITPHLKNELEVKGMKLGQPIFIRIFKESKELEIWIKVDAQYKLFKTYPICAYSGALGPKQKEGDKQAPEGFYAVHPDQMNEKSKYHLSFNIGFPNSYDKAHGRTGSYLMVHGNCISVGCYAMTNARMEEIYLLAEAALASGQSGFQVHIFPFRMTNENLQNHQLSPWMAFWTNLKQGYDYFETKKLPPTIGVRKKEYLIIGN